MYLYLDDGSVFCGRGITSNRQAAGLVSYFTGVVGYQEMITDPANRGKILLFTYPEIGNYGVNSTDAESDSVAVSGVIAKEYCPFYSNFRAEECLKSYLERSGTAFLDHIDTRAVLIKLREQGEMWGVISPDSLSIAEVKERIAAKKSETESGRISVSSAAEQPEDCQVRHRAMVIDVGAGRSFYKTLASLGIGTTGEQDSAELVIVSPAPFYAVDNSEVIAGIRNWIGKKPVLGIGDGAALVAAACSLKPEWMGFGHHGMNFPVKFNKTGRKEITVQNHNYIVPKQDAVDVIFENVNDGTPEGFYFKDARAAGISFMPDKTWLDDILGVLEVA